jgi:hypothetical protein
MLDVMADTTQPPPPPWGAPLHHQRCNFHTDRPAIATFAGTPVCADCAERLGWPPRNGERAA